MVVRGFYKLIGLLAAVALEQIHGIHGYCVASNVVFIHGGLLIWSALNAGPPLYTSNDSCVITQHVVVWACRRLSAFDCRGNTLTKRHGSKNPGPWWSGVQLLLRFRVRQAGDSHFLAEIAGINKLGRENSAFPSHPSGAGCARLVD